jgi:hypothetical protein
MPYPVGERPVATLAGQMSRKAHQLQASWSGVAV